jgi:hypothetical protein
MRRLIVGLVLMAQVGAARAQDETHAAPATEGEASAALQAPADKIQIGVALLPMLLGKVAAGPSGEITSAKLDAAYGIGLWFGYRVARGLSVGVAPQVILHLNAKDSDGYPVLDSEKEYDLMARIAYAYPVLPKLEVYAELLPGYAIVTYDKIIMGLPAPLARGMVVGGGVGAMLAVTDRVFANAGVGYQLGFQRSSGSRDVDVRTRFLRIALGGGVRF